jgi:hypothetical protein
MKAKLFLLFMFCISEQVFCMSEIFTPSHGMMVLAALDAAASAVATVSTISNSLLLRRELKKDAEQRRIAKVVLYAGLTTASAATAVGMAVLSGGTMSEAIFSAASGTALRFVKGVTDHTKDLLEAYQSVTNGIVNQTVTSVRSLAQEVLDGTRATIDYSGIVLDGVSANATARADIVGQGLITDSHLAMLDVAANTTAGVDFVGRGLILEAQRAMIEAATNATQSLRDVLQEAIRDLPVYPGPIPL